MSIFRPLALLVLTIGILVAGGYLHGQWTGRWYGAATFDEIQTDMEKVPALCEVCGPWVGHRVKTDLHAILKAEGTPNIWVRYVNKMNGQAVMVYLTCGRPGPMVIKHLPTECYPSSGYQTTKAPSRFVTQPLATRGTAEFYQATFSKTQGALPIHLRTYWSWSGDGDWKTPERPRWTFSKFRWLYKLYVVRSLESDREPFEGCPAHDFIREFLPELNRVLFSQGKPPGEVMP